MFTRRCTHQQRIKLHQPQSAGSLKSLIAFNFQRRYSSRDSRIRETFSRKGGGVQPTVGVCTSKASSVGFGGLEVFTPKDWIRMAQRAEGTVVSIVNELTSKKMTPSEIVFKMDQISDTICQVVDAAELCRNAHPNSSMVTAASQAVLLLQKCINQLNTNHDLYQLSKDCTLNRHLLSPEEYTVINKLKIEFEHNGVHLENLHRISLYELQDKLQQLTSNYMHSLNNDDRGGNKLKINLPKDLLNELEGLKYSINKKNDPDNDSNTTSLLIDEAVANEILKSAHPELRKIAYHALNSSHEHLRILDDILVCRQQLAEFLGFSSYSHMTAWNRILKTPQQIDNFLHELLAKVKKQSQEELKKIHQLKMKSETKYFKTTTESIPISHHHHKLYHWDMHYKSIIENSEWQKISDHKIDMYLSLGDCLEGLSILSEHLFGIELSISDIGPHEGWHPDVRKLVASHSQTGYLGSIYLDLFTRPGKFTGSANFPLRLSSIHSTGASVGLLCNYPRREYGTLTLEEAETLFHEFGHVFHNILSRTKYQHSSGTRCYIDFVETPSTLMEFFFNDYRVISLFARHCKTGSTLPIALFHHIQKTKHSFRANNLSNQLYHSLLDNTFHAGPLPKNSTVVAEDIHHKIWATTNHSDVEMCYSTGTFPHVKHTHFIGYAGAYYSYLYSELHAGNIWKHCFSGNPLDRTAGENFKQNILAHGGAKEPQEMMQCVVGAKSLSVDAILDTK